MGGPGSGRRKKVVAAEEEEDDPNNRIYLRMVERGEEPEYPIVIPGDEQGGVGGSRVNRPRVESSRGVNPVLFPGWEEVKREVLSPAGEWVSADRKDDAVFIGTIPESEEELRRVLSFAKGKAPLAEIKREGPVTRSRKKRIAQDDPCKGVTPKKSPRKDDDGAGPSKMSGGKTPPSSFPPFYYYVG